jgi:hypothetical protein
MYDPTIDTPADPMQAQLLEQQREDVLRQIRIAEMLRRGAGAPGATPEMPQGQMVSGHYIAPHWTQQLAATVNPIFQQFNARQAENQADQKQSALASAVAKAKEAWASQMPTTTPATPEMPAPPQGPPTEGGVQPAQVGTIPAQPAMLPSAVERAKYLARGLQIPGNEGAVGIAGKTMGEEVTREDTQQARKENLAAQTAAARQNKLDQLEFQRQQLEAQMNDRNTSREQQAILARERDQTLRAIAAGNQEVRREIAANKGNGGLSPAQQAVQDRFISTQAEHVSRRAEQLAPMLQSAQVVQDMLDENGVDLKTGKTKPIEGLGYVGKLPGFMLSEAGSVNRAKVKAFANSMLRAQAGLSQTLSETENANLELLANGNYTQKEFERVWPTVMAKINSSIDNLQAGAEPEAWAKYAARGGRLNKIESKRVAGETALSPADQARLEQLRAAKAAEGK